MFSQEVVISRVPEVRCDESVEVPSSRPFLFESLLDSESSRCNRLTLEQRLRDTTISMPAFEEGDGRRTALPCVLGDFTHTYNHVKNHVTRHRDCMFVTAITYRLPTLGFFAVFGNIDFVGLPMAPKWPTEGSQGQYGMFRQHTTP